MVGELFLPPWLSPPFGLCRSGADPDVPGERQKLSMRMKVKVGIRSEEQIKGGPEL